MDAMMYMLGLGGRMLLLSGLLLLTYVVFVRRRADYRMCRRMLLSFPFLCMAVPALHYACGQLSAFREPQQVVLTKAQAGEYIRTMPVGTTVQDASVQPERPVAVPEKANYERPLRAVVWGILAVSILLLLLMGGQLLLLTVRCRRMARLCTVGADGVVRSHEVDTPFSFGRRIFLPADRLTAGGERLVIMHEQAHVRSGHAAEGLLMEALCRLMWFNPFMWMVRKELRNVQEFEADRQVLDAGTEILAYQTLLLEEVMKESPVLVDGFNRSFVRQRFVEMKVAGRRRCPLAWKLLAVFMLVCMTGLASAGHVRKAVVLKIVDEDTSAIVRLPAVGSASSAEALPMSQPPAAGTELEEATPSAQPSHPETEEDERPVRAQDGWPILYALPATDEPGAAGVRMRHTEDETLLAFTETVRSDDEFYKFGGPECYIVDCATGVHYQARRSIPAEAWNYFYLRGMKGKAVTVSVVFPRLPESVREIALYRVTGHLQSDRRFKVSSILVK